jgi:hypothetical protein
LGKKDHANPPRGFHKNEGRNNHRIVIRVDDAFLREKVANAGG